MTQPWTLQLARIAVRRNGYWAIALLFSAAFGIASLLAFLAVIPSLNERNMRALNAQLLRRAELAADHALLALAELYEGGFADCDTLSIVQMRNTIYRYSNLKDVRVFSSQKMLCSAYPEVIDTGAVAENPEPSLSAVNRHISLSPVSEKGNVAVDIKWSLDDNTSLDAVMSTSSLLFDILPQDLRECGTASLTLSDGRPVADSESNQSVDSERLHRVFMTSNRYPLIASIGVDLDTLAKANHEALIATVLLFSAIGFFFGIFAATLAVQSGGTIAEIDAGLSRNEFLPFVQPIYSLTTREMVGVEVLARWRRADGTLIPPDRFIPTAEASGRIIPLTWQLARTALAGLREPLSCDRKFKAAFNISPAQLLSHGFVDTFRQIVVEAGVSPRQIIIEITERQEISDMSKAEAVLSELRHRGFRVAFDDVGTGHNGLSYLQKLGADVIKIDKFLVDSIVTSHSAEVLVEMLVHVARELEMTTVAEGIETEEQVASLKRCGVDQGQGFLLSRPLPIADLRDLFNASGDLLASAGDRQVPPEPAMAAQPRAYEPLRTLT
jgi:sensor c-di-GMP phosphodiesterase-like protein